MARYVNLSDTANNPEALDHLQSACEPAAFGRNTETVLDETYRKAGKMDASAFMTRLDPYRAGLVNAIRLALLEGAPDGSSVLRSAEGVRRRHGTFPIAILPFGRSHGRAGGVSRNRSHGSDGERLYSIKRNIQISCNPLSCY